MDPRRSPQRIGNAHLADKLAYLRRYSWSATTAPRLHRQYDLNPARCHLITVSGFTIAKAPSTFGAKRYKPAKIRRSSIPNVGRFGDCRRSTLS
jgi:hypothetical protein